MQQTVYIYINMHINIIRYIVNIYVERGTIGIILLDCGIVILIVDTKVRNIY